MAAQPHFLIRWQWRELNTPLGRWLLAGPQPRLGFLGLAGKSSLADLQRLLRTQGLPAQIEQDDSSHAPAAAQLLEYADGERRSLDVELELHGTAFDCSVWRLLQSIPYGQTRSYGDLARRLGNPGLARAVGGANGRNPLPVIVPCHRVVAQNGFGGYSGGLEIKRRLLQLEGLTLF